jgi:hypothetical protein
MDEESIKSFANFKSEFIKKIGVFPKQTDGKTLISIELVKSLDTFDYLVEDPSRLVIDLYQNPDEVKSAKKQDKSKTQSEAKNKKTDKEVATVTQDNKAAGKRTPATADFLKVEKTGDMSVETDSKKNVAAGIFDGADPFYERFSIKDYEIKEEAIILSKENYYIPFPDIDLPVVDWNKIKLGENVFEVIPKNNEENKHVRLLQTLMDNKRNQVFYPLCPHRSPMSDTISHVHGGGQLPHEHPFYQSSKLFPKPAARHPYSQLRDPKDES